MNYSFEYFSPRISNYITQKLCTTEVGVGREKGNIITPIDINVFRIITYQKLRIQRNNQCLTYQIYNNFPLLQKFRITDRNWNEICPARNQDFTTSNQDLADNESQFQAVWSWFHAGHSYRWIEDLDLNGSLYRLLWISYQQVLQ